MCFVSLGFLWGDFIELLFVGGLLTICSIILLICSSRIHNSVQEKKKVLGVPNGKILYSDLNVPAAPFFSKRSRLVGKPDYIIQKNDVYIPIEVKSGKSQNPHQSQLLQLAAYCKIFEDVFGVFVPEGILVYNNTKYTIPFDPKLRFELESIIKTMHISLQNSTVKINHQDIARCKNCSMKKYCVYAL